MCRLTPPRNAGSLPEIQAGSMEITKCEPLYVEIETFIEAVKSQDSSLGVSGPEGRRALSLALQVLQKKKDHSLRAGIGLSFD
jgi:hypothetical protein